MHFFYFRWNRGVDVLIYEVIELEVEVEDHLLIHHPVLDHHHQHIHLSLSTISICTSSSSTCIICISPSSTSIIYTFSFLYQHLSLFEFDQLEIHQLLHVVRYLQTLLPDCKIIHELFDRDMDSIKDV